MDLDFHKWGTPWNFPHTCPAPAASLRLLVAKTQDGGVAQSIPLYESSPTRRLRSRFVDAQGAGARRDWRARDVAYSSTTTQKQQNQRQKLDKEFSLSPRPYHIARVVCSLLGHGAFACLARDWAALESDQNRPCPVNRCPRKYHRRDKLRSHLLGGHKLDISRVDELCSAWQCGTRRNV